MTSESVLFSSYSSYVLFFLYFICIVKLFQRSLAPPGGKTPVIQYILPPWIYFFTSAAAFKLLKNSRSLKKNKSLLPQNYYFFHIFLYLSVGFIYLYMLLYLLYRHVISCNGSRCACKMCTLILDCDPGTRRIPSESRPFLSKNDNNCRENTKRRMNERQSHSQRSQRHTCFFLALQTN